MTENPPPDDAWLTTAEAAGRLRTSVGKILTAVLADVPEEARAWLNIGTLERPRYRWEVSRIDAWWRLAARPFSNRVYAEALRTGLPPAQAAARLQARGVPIRELSCRPRR